MTTLIEAEFDMVMNSKKVRRPAELQYQFTLGRIDVRDPFFLVPFAELKRKSRARNMQQAGGISDPVSILPLLLAC